MAGPDLDGKIKVRTIGVMGDEPPRAPGLNDQGMDERLHVRGHDEPEALAPGLMDRLGAGLHARAVIFAALSLMTRAARRDRRSRFNRHSREARR